MSLSLSSLLNPASQSHETEAEQGQESTNIDKHSPLEERDNVPSTTFLQSPELQHTQLPRYTPPQRPRASIASTNSGVGQRSAQEAAPTKDDPLTHTSQTREQSSADNVEESRRSPLHQEQQAIVLSGQAQDAATVMPTKEDHMPGSTETKDDTSAEQPQASIRPAEQLVMIKQEDASPLETSRDITMTGDDNQASRTISTLKHEHISRTQSPLRESSVLPTTEDNSPANVKKRAAPAKTKKGMATVTKKPKPGTKKRKMDGVKNVKARSSPTPSDAASAQDYDEDDSMADSDEDVEGSGEVYCICKRPDNGTFMIGCDGKCDDWFHGKCVSIEERDKNLIDKYICPRCTQAGVGRTSWKRMCRREGCRLPARVGRNANKDGSTSKYCSDECGVLFFRQMTANAKGDTKRAPRRKSVSDKVDEARGGVLYVGEIRAMLDQTNNAAEFRDLGNGVLSPPPTPTANENVDSGLTEADHAAIEVIAAEKDKARQRHQTLKDRLKFIALVRTQATKIATEKDVKPKDYCGSDSRLEWSEEDFAAWRQSSEGQQAFDTDSLSSVIPEGVEVCSRKRCMRHADWSKLAVDDVRFEMTDNSNRMRNLEQEESELRERAALRSKAAHLDADEARVQIHDNHIPNGVSGLDDVDSMDIDVPVVA